ncbi:MAG TPA: SDR family NAD(P)-dependent oxidoreductase [Cyclobacteriaceae bacterium]|nr:SDR family NAD(P)-dependent oxidoreductase [Cyclobacteriaceae bacterium]
MKSVIITGATGGLGKVVCEQFLELGYHVFGSVSKRSADKVLLKHDKLSFSALDLTNEKEVEAWMNEIFQNHQPEGILMLAGGFAMGKLSETNADTMQSMLNRNFFTSFFAAKTGLNLYKKHKIGGCFIFISSGAGFKIDSGTDYGAYALSKNLLHGLANLIFNEGKAFKVRCHVFIPGVLDTPSNKKSMPDADQSKWSNILHMAKVMHQLVDNKESKFSEIIL